jgi:hypothetical protein
MELAQSLDAVEPGGFGPRSESKKPRFTGLIQFYSGFIGLLWTVKI